MSGFSSSPRCYSISCCGFLCSWADSHGLLASLIWSALAGVLGFAVYSTGHKNWRLAGFIAVAVLSHWVLDAFVHQPELALIGSGSRLVGLGLRNNMPVALMLEAVIVTGGLCLFIPAAGLARPRSVTLVALTVLAMVFTAVGMTAAPAPPSATAMAGGSLATLALVCAVAWWCGRRKR
jgi:hypothetical protein